MKNLLKLLVIVFTFIIVTAQGQDYILKLNIGIDNLYCTNISIQNDTVKFVVVKGNVESITSIDDVYGIHFYDNKPDELLLLSFQIDTILSVIDSISNKEIYYRDANRLLHSIGISDVFCILFDIDISNPKIESFYDQFIILQKRNYNNNPKLIKKDRTKIDISNSISMINDTIDIQILSKQKITDTYATTNTLSSYIHKEPVDRQKEVYFRQFVLSKEDILREVVINEFIDKKINFRLTGNKKKITLEQDKKSITGIFFYDYNTKEIPIKEKVLPVVKEPGIVKDEKKLPDSKLTFDLSAGFGYMLKLEKSFTLPQENEAYLNKLRKGFAFDANLKMFITKGFGIGVKYNQFNTSSNAQNVISENISIRFIGGTIFGNLPVMKNKGVFSVDLSLGLLTKDEYFEIYNQPYNLKGHTLGVYVSAGLEYFVMKNITLGLSFGLLGGSLEKIDINSSYNIILDKPYSLSRFDSMVRIKAYL